jgi:hypothetical protein
MYPNPKLTPTITTKYTAKKQLASYTTSTKKIVYSKDCLPEFTFLSYITFHRAFKLAKLPLDQLE